MKRTDSLRAGGVLFLLFGIGLLTAPRLVFSTFHADVSGFGLDVARLWGAANVGLGIAGVLASQRNSAVGQMPVLLGFVLVNAAYSALYLAATLRGLIGSVGWVSVVLHLVLALVLAGRYVMGPASPPTQS